MYTLVSNLTGTKNLFANIIITVVTTVIFVCCIALLCNLGLAANASFGIIG